MQTAKLKSTFYKKKYIVIIIIITFHYDWDYSFSDTVEIQKLLAEYQLLQTNIIIYEISQESKDLTTHFRWSLHNPYVLYQVLRIFRKITIKYKRDL